MSTRMPVRSTRITPLFVVLVALVGLAESASASDSGAPTDAGSGVRVTGEQFSAPDNNAYPAGAFWPSQERQEAYVLHIPANNSDAKDYPYSRISRVTLPSGEPILTAQLGDGNIGGYRAMTPETNEGAGITSGSPHTMVLDEAGGRVFVAYQYLRPGVGGTLPGAQADAGRGTACVGRRDTVWGFSCVAGVLVLDALTLEQIGRVDLRNVGPDAAPLNGQLLAMEYAPPRTPEESGKILVQLVTPTHVSTVAESVNVQPDSLHAQPQFVAQLDPDRETLDWVVRLDPCRGNRTPAASSYTEAYMVRALPHHSALFRSASLKDPAVVVGCRASSSWTGTVVQVPLDALGNPSALPLVVGDAAGEVGAVGAGARPQPGNVVAPAASPRVITGPDRVVQMLADPVSERLLMRVVDGDAEVWWVYDHKVGAFTATIGIGAVNPQREARYVTNLSALDRQTGRLYVMAPPWPPRAFPGGLFMADIRRTPLPQALHFPHIAGEGLPPVRDGYAGDPEAASLVVAPAGGQGQWPRRVYVPSRHQLGKAGLGPLFFRVVEDRVAVSTDPDEEFAAGRTLDLEEIEGVTAVSADGAARGYGARLLLVGGVDAVARVGPADPMGNVNQCNHQIPNATATAFPTYGPCAGSENSIISGKVGSHVIPFVPAQGNVVSPCSSSNRELVLGAVGVEGPAVLDASGGRGSAEPVVTDSSLRSDMEAPASRCSAKDWDLVWGTALFGRAPVEEPAVGSPGTERSAQCVSGENDSDSVGDPVGGVFAARMDCGDGEVGGFSYVRGQDLGEAAKVAEALSSFRVYRDPGRGIVARIESVARGVSIDGVIRIDSVRGTAESWANGRRQFTARDERPEGYDPNCDRERTAGTCFQRHLFGVKTPGYSCGPCGDEATLIDRLGRAMGANGVIRLREADEVLAKGAENGFQAAVVKPVSERFADLVLNTDLLQTTLPTLEIIRYAPPNRVLTGGGPRGRQIIQLAGVEVSTSYSISCLLIYDEASNTCAEPTEEPGSITVSLADADGKALAGGAFEVRVDVDADGLLGLKDTLLPNGACVTAEDGVGTCKLDNLAPGAYLVGQVAAPPGYAKSAEPFLVELASGEARTVAFTNVSNLSTIELKATDANGAPVSGAGFAAYPDPDADGKVAPDAQPAAQCTTDTDGFCTMRVPAGSYVLVQTGAPGGLEGIEPVAFTFASGGQTAAVTVVNYPPESPAQPDAPAAPVYTPPVDVAPPIEVVDTYDPQTDTQPLPEVAPGPSVSEQVGGTVVRVIRAPGDALRLLSRDPKQAVAWTAALALFAIAALAVQRRTRLGALAYAGGPTAPPHRPPPTQPTRPTGGPRPSHGGGGPGGPRGAGGSGGPPPGTPPRERGDGARESRIRPRANRNASTDLGEPSTQAAGAVAVLDTPLVAGAAPSSIERVHASVVVATGHPVLAAVATQRLSASPHCTVLAHVDSLTALRDCIATGGPDVVVVDLGLRGTNADADIFDELGDMHPINRVVGLVPPHRSAKALTVRGYSAGIGGLLAAEEDLTNGQLAYAVRCVATGKPFFGPSIQAFLLQRKEPRIATGPSTELTPREVEIARLAVRGMSRTQIARELFVGPTTVKTHLRAIRAKLGVTNPRDIRQMQRRLEELGLAEPPTQS